MSDTSRESVLVPLADRARWTGGVRLALVGASLALWVNSPGDRTGATSDLVLPASFMVVAALLTLVAPRAGRSAALVALGAGLLLDGIWLAWCFHLLGGVDGPAGFLLVGHVAAVTLLSSFRSGLKVAIWQVLLLVCVIEAELAALLPTSLDRFPVQDFAVLASAIGLGALATAAFAAGNERELRRRRYDAEVLRAFALDLEHAVEPGDAATRLALLARAELLAERAVVVVLPSTAGAGRRGAREVVGHAARAGEEDLLQVPAAFPVESVADRALQQRRTLLASVLGPEDGWLHDLLPGARNVVVVPLSSDEEASGALLLELGERAEPSRLMRLLAGDRTATVDRRLVATAEQATAHTALAVSRTALVARLRAAADLDGLTGIANRRALDRALAREVRRTAGGGEPCSLVIVDLDHFKRLNDQHGHQVGDEALRAAAAALDATSRPGDVVARYGGEEFVVVLPGTTADDAVAVAHRLRQAVLRSDSPVPLTASLGVACTVDAGADAAELLGWADRALYVAKATGRDRVVDSRAVVAGLVADEAV